MSDDDKTPAPSPKDVVFVGSSSADGATKVLRFREDRIETGEMRPARDGAPIVGEFVKLTPRGEHERLFDVEVIAKGAEPASRAQSPALKGPAKINSPSFRSNWDAIFGASEGETPDRKLN